MKNKKKFKKELYNILVNGDRLAVDPNGNPVSCDTIICSDCKLCPGMGYCPEYRKEWLESEYIGPEVDWSKVPIDTKVLVRDLSNSEWIPRYFAGLNENGEKTVWQHGGTSFTASDVPKSVWNYIKLYKEGDNDEN